MQHTGAVEEIISATDLTKLNGFPVLGQIARFNLERKKKNLV